MKREPPQVFRSLPEKLSLSEAKERIDEILFRYGENCSVEFREFDAEIIDSYLVNSQEDRHLVCEIISRTGLTDRSYENLAAEWEVHNAAYRLNVARSDAKDVSLDYRGDPRKSVRLATALFDKLDLE
ncbi:MAG: hypothetical protein J6P48_01620 [Oscillospiraceae bacterium]|nr:hypothetical protein [Oscillospiraceae bacterium]